MSIATSLTALQTARTDIAAAITTKGGTVGSGDGFADFADDIATIPTGGGVLPVLDNPASVNDVTIGKEFIDGDGIKRTGNNTSQSVLEGLITRTVENVVIPDGVTKIGASAFNGCSRIVSLAMPNSIMEVESSAMSGCSNLTSLTLSNSLATIGVNAFYGCNKLTEFVFTSNIQSIAASAFNGCGRVTVFSFLQCEKTPQLANANAFPNTAIYSIIVPDVLYETWITETNWVSLASKIVKASDYNA